MFITILCVDPLPVGETQHWATEIHVKDYADFIQHTSDMQYRLMPDGTRQSVGTFVKVSPTYYVFVYTTAQPDEDDSYEY